MHKVWAISQGSCFCLLVENKLYFLHWFAIAEAGGGGASWMERDKGGNWDKCNSINNKTFKQKINTKNHLGIFVSVYSWAFCSVPLIYMCLSVCLSIHHSNIYLSSIIVPKHIWRKKEQNLFHLRMQIENIF